MGDEPIPMKPASPEQAVFTEALRCATPEARAAYLDGACGTDTALRRRVEALLRAAESAGDFLEQPPTGLAAGDGSTLVVTELSEKPGDRIGRYKLLQQIGEGGCGVVYMAEQEEPVRRRVALKVIKLGMDTKSVIARFEAERQALALMDHPNIAKVLDAGATDTGRPYFVMELVRGIKITDYCDQNNLSTKERLELFMEVCQAIQHAHQKGIIHRDIKPSNILVTQHDDVAVPKVIDFGIAKATIGQLTDKTVFTAFAQFMGTPAYMSPEQAQMSGLDIDTRADIYSLGVLLYELLTGNTPFDAKELLAAGMDEMRRKIREDEPAKPSTCLSTMQAMDLTTVARRRHVEPPRLIHLIRGDLDWLVMKCLEKDRTRRYETANALVMDLQRHLDDEPVVACPPSRSYRFQKLVRRNKLAFTAAGVVVAALVLGIFVSTWQAVRATRAEALAKEQRTLASRSADDANAQRAVSEAETRRAKQEEARANEQASLARRRLYAAQINLAYQSWEASNGPGALELLEGQRPKFDQEDLRTFEWYHLWGLCQADHRFTLRGHRGLIQVVAFSPDGKTLASTSYDATVKLWDVATGQERLTLRGLQGFRGGMAFSPDGRMLATGGFLGQGKVWDVTTGKELPVQFPEHSMEGAVAFSPDGKTLAGGNFFGMIKLWDVATWQEKARIQSDKGRVKSLAFSPDGKILASAAEWGDARARFWDLTADPPRLVREFPGHRAVAFSPNGECLAVCYAYGDVKLYDVATGEERASHPGHLGAVYSLAFSPDGKRLAFGTQNRSARIWDPATGEEQACAHLSPVGTIAFSPDGNVFASASEDGIIKLWDLAKRPAAASFPMVKGSRSPAFSPDGATLAFIGPKGSVELFELATGQSRSIPALAYAKAWLTFAADGKTLAQLSGSRARLYDLRSGQELATFKVRYLTFSPDGKTFATADGNRPAIAQLWDLDTKQTRTSLKSMPSESVSALAFSPDGRTLAAGGSLGWVRLWNPTNGETQATLQEAVGSYDWLGCLAFAPDGKLLATGNWDGTVKLWDVSTRQLRASLKGHTAMVSAMAFFPDGRTLVTASEDRTLKFWDVATAQERLTFKGHSPDRYSLAISSDGTILAAVAEGDTIILRRAATDKEAVAFQSELNPDNPESPVAQNKAGDRFWADGRRQDAERAYRQALSRLEQLISRFPQRVEYLEELIYSHLVLSVLLRSSDRTEEAERAYHRVIELRANFASNYPDQIEPRSVEQWLANLAKELQRQGKLAESEAVWREELAMEKKLSGEEHPFVANSLHGLATVLRDSGKWSEAEAMFRQALDMRRKLLGNENLTVANSLAWLGTILSDQGKHAEAEAAYRETLALQRKLPADEPLLADALARLTRTLLVEQKFTEAEPLARECLTVRENKLPDDWLTFNARSMLGHSLLGQKKYAEAEPLLLSGYEGMKQREDKIPAASKRYVKETLQRIVQLYEATDQSEKAAEWKRKLTKFDQTETEKKAAVPRP